MNFSQPHLVLFQLIKFLHYYKIVLMLHARVMICVMLCLKCQQKYVLKEITYSNFCNIYIHVSIVVDAFDAIVQLLVHT